MSVRATLTMLVLDDLEQRAERDREKRCPICLKAIGRAGATMVRPAVGVAAMAG